MSLFPPIRRLVSSERVVCDVIFNEQEFQPPRWLALTILVDLLFFSAFFLTTLKIESDLFIYYTLPILTATTYLRRPMSRHIATVSTCIALALATYAVFRDTGGEFDSQAQEFQGSQGIERLLVNVLLIRFVALVGAAFIGSQLISSFRYSRALLSSVLDTIPIVLWRKRSDGVYTFANRHFTTLINRPYHEILGRTDYHLFGRAARRFRDGDNWVIKERKPFTDPLEPLPLPDGTKQVNFVYKVPLFGAGGQVIGTQGLFIDITTMLSGAMQDVQVLSALASHARTLNHEVQNQLDTISLCAQLARESFQQVLQGKNGSTRQEVSNQCNAIHEITSQLRNRLDNLARLRKGLVKEEHLDLVQLVADELRRIKAHTHPFTVQWEACPGPVTISGDAIHLCDAVRNLVINAKEGIVRYQSKRECQSPVFAVKVLTDTPRTKASITVVNTAEISEQDLRNLRSGRSLSLKPDASAHGLGLPSVRLCVALHNGKFTISRSSEHKDCIVACVELPLVT